MYQEVRKVHDEEKDDTLMVIPETYGNPEGTLVDGTSNASNGVCSIGASGTLLHPLSSNLQLGLAEVGDHPLTIDAEELGNL